MKPSTQQRRGDGLGICKGGFTPPEFQLVGANAGGITRPYNCHKCVLV